MWLVLSFPLLLSCAPFLVSTELRSLGQECRHVRDCDKRLGAICGYPEEDNSSDSPGGSPVCRCPPGSLRFGAVCSTTTRRVTMEEAAEARSVPFGDRCNAGKDTCSTPGSVCTLICGVASCGRCQCPPGLILCFGQCVAPRSLGQTCQINLQCEASLYGSRCSGTRCVFP